MNRRLPKAAVFALLVLLAIPTVFPLVWMVSTSLKTDAQIFPTGGQSAAPFGLASLVPHPARWANYADAVHKVPFRVYFRNTAILCVLNVAFAVFSSAIVAYGFARLRLIGKEILFGLMLATMAVPEQVTMVPRFALVRALGWYGTILPLTVPALFGSALYIFLLTQFFRSLPEELAEASRLDGAGEWSTFWRVMLPLAKPALATCALFQFVGTWNDFLGPLIYLNDPSQYTVAYGLQQFMAKNGSQWALLMAGSTIFIVPVVIVFFSAQKSFIQGIATTGGRN
jgi:multiple sugar transport system permease protein